MDTITALTTRVSSPRLQEPGPSDSQLDMLLRAAILALVVTALYVANYINGWITVEDLILWGPSTGAE